MMKTMQLNNQKTMPTLGLGTWLSEPGEVYNIVKSAIKEGYRHIDCAAIYGNEKEIGKALSEIFSEGVVKRADLFITSKLWNNAHEPKNVLPALKHTLSELKLDYLDLYLIHWPIAFKADIMVPTKADDYIPLKDVSLASTYLEMEKSIEMGLVKSLGVSNFSGKKIDDLMNQVNIKPVVNQVELHPYLHQNDLLSFCQNHDIILTAYSPLGSAGRPPQLKGQDEPLILENPLLIELAKKYHKTPAQIVLNWGMSRGTIVIPKTVTPARAIENFKSQDFELDSADMQRLEGLDRHFRFVDGAFFSTAGSGYTIANLWDE